MFGNPPKTILEDTTVAANFNEVDTDTEKIEEYLTYMKEQEENLITTEYQKQEFINSYFVENSVCHLEATVKTRSASWK